MSSLMYYKIFIMFWLGIWGLWVFKLLKMKHVLSSLLVIEMFMLTTFLIIMSLLNSLMIMSSMLVLTYFTMAVCEASVGIAILVAHIRLTQSSMLVI